MNGRKYVAFAIAADEVPWLVAATVRMALFRVLTVFGADDSPIAREAPAMPVSRSREQTEAMTEAEALAHMATPAFRLTCAEIAARLVAGEPMTMGNVADALGVPYAMLGETVSAVIGEVVPGLHGVVLEATEVLH
ncbi:hypothetical protein RUR49_19010 [Pseudoxanthobacter sp. M-2]|uniref:hypothetical protein n=1 Tax=Pseudoxanthobacter sp. M-2 TaxID=3078754 RepID=UPI0038FC097B